MLPTKLLPALIPIVGIRVAGKHTQLGIRVARKHTQQLGEDKGSTRHSIESCNRKIR